MKKESVEDKEHSENWQEIAYCAFKLGSMGFGGIAGMVSTLENELVIKRKWISHHHFLDVLAASYIIPGPNVVEIVMHCGKERGGKVGLVIAGICYILPALLICLAIGYFYKQYSALPDVQDFIFGLRPAITALVIGTVVRMMRNSLIGNYVLIGICLFVFGLALYGISEIALILGAGMIYYFISLRNKLNTLVFIPLLSQVNYSFSNTKLFLVFFKIGAILYGSGYVLFAYMDEALVQHLHWLSSQQLMDAIAVGQMTPGPILSSATFAGFLINGFSGGVLATVAIFLPSFFISYFLHELISLAHTKKEIRIFLDGLSAASISIIAVVGVHLLKASVQHWQGIAILNVCVLLTVFFKKINTIYILLTGSLGGLILVKLFPLI